MHNTPTATPTGIVIGGAYTQRLKPLQAEPIEVHRPGLLRRLIVRLFKRG